MGIYMPGKTYKWQNQIWAGSFDPNWTSAIECDDLILFSSVVSMLMIPRKFGTLIKNTISFELWIMQEFVL